VLPGHRDTLGRSGVAGGEARLVEAERVRLVVAQFGVETATVRSEDAPDDGVRLDDDQHVGPPRPDSAEQNLERPLGGSNPWPLAPRHERSELLAQR